MSTTKTILKQIDVAVEVKVDSSVQSPKFWLIESFNGLPTKVGCKLPLKLSCSAFYEGIYSVVSNSANDAARAQMEQSQGKATVEVSFTLKGVYLEGDLISKEESTYTDAFFSNVSSNGTMCRANFDFHQVVRFRGGCLLL